MQIDRRELMTGFASLAVAPSVPARPAADPFYFSAAAPENQPYGRDFVYLVLDVLWQFDRTRERYGLIRHVPTGLICRRVHTDDDPLYTLEVLHFGEFEALDHPALRPLLYAAAHVGLEAYRFSAKGRVWREQAFFITHTLPLEPEIRDGYTVCDFSAWKAPLLVLTATNEAIERAAQCVRETVLNCTRLQAPHARDSEFGKDMERAQAFIKKRRNMHRELAQR